MSLGHVIDSIHLIYEMGFAWPESGSSPEGVQYGAVGGERLSLHLSSLRTGRPQAGHPLHIGPGFPPGLVDLKGKESE